MVQAQDSRTVAAVDAGLVTPEAVVLGLPVASVGSRGVAFVIDALIQLAMVVGLVFAAATVDTGSLGWVGTTIVLLALFMILIGYPVGFETFLRGRTPGKAALGLRVVTVEAGPVGFRHAAIRGALALVDFWMTSGAGAVVTALVTKRGQRLGDLAAGTIVVRERSGAGRVEPATFGVPAGGHDYVARVDASGLDERDYQAMRSVLVGRRMDRARLDPLAVQVLQRVAGRVSPGPPAGMPPVDVLACLATAYQHRHRRVVARDVTALLWEHESSARVE